MKMKKITIKASILAALVALLACGCEKPQSKKDYEDDVKYFDSWVTTNYPEARKSALGAYILSDTPGTGRPFSIVYPFASVNYTVRDLDGNVTSTTDRKTAQRVYSNYSMSDYYGPRIWMMAAGAIYSGLFDTMANMREGGKRTIAIPGWLMTYNYYTDPEKYHSVKETGANCIYDVTMETVAEDLDKYLLDSLKRYVARNLEGVDSTKYGFYYLQTKAPASSREMPNDTTFYINYTGRLLDGTVFDTNIADTAKVYDIYSSSRDYRPKVIRKNSDYRNITMSDIGASSASNVLEGFAYCLSKLKALEGGTCVFYHELGYDYNGSGKSIPPYSSLRFDIEVVPKP